jgi:hypothetical protein
MKHGITMGFLDSLKKANLSSLSMMSEPATLNGQPIRVAIDDLSQTSFARSGGRTTDTESAVFVSEEEFLAAGGKKGSTITFENGKTSIVQKISDFQGVLYLALAPFKP